MFSLKLIKLYLVKIIILNKAFSLELSRKKLKYKNETKKFVYI